jgi:hypothetical protein
VSPDTLAHPVRDRRGSMIGILGLPILDRRLVGRLIPVILESLTGSPAPGNSTGIELAAAGRTGRIDL